MRSILEIIIALAIAALFFLGLGFLLPSSGRIERSIDIERPAIHIYDVANSIGRFSAWSPWTSRDPRAVLTASDIKDGEGAKVSWTSKVSGVDSGSHEIAPGGKPMELVKLNLDLGADRKGTGEIKIKSEEVGTRVTMSFETKFNSILQRYRGLYLDSEQGDKLTIGLSGLKAMLENSPYAGNYADIPIEIKELTPTPALQLSYTSRGYKGQELNVPRDRQFAFESIEKVIDANKLTRGAGQFLETSRDDAAYVVTFDTTIPVDRNDVKLGGDVKAVMTAGGKYLVATHIGRRDTWNLPSQTKEKAFAYAAVHDLSLSPLDSGRRIFVEYLSPPETQESEFKTNVYIPIE
jgi:hypothetical protein